MKLKFKNRTCSLKSRNGSSYFVFYYPEELIIVNFAENLIDKNRIRLHQLKNILRYIDVCAPILHFIDKNLPNMMRRADLLEVDQYFNSKLLYYEASCELNYVGFLPSNGTISNFTSTLFWQTEIKELETYLMPLVPVESKEKSIVAAIPGVGYRIYDQREHEYTPSSEMFLHYLSSKKLLTWETVQKEMLLTSPQAQLRKLITQFI